MAVDIATLGLELKTDKLTPALDVSKRTRAELNKLADSADAVGQRGSSGMSKLGAGILSLRNILVGAGIVGAMTAIVRATAENERNTRLLEVALKNNGRQLGLSVGQLKDYAAQMQRTTTFSDGAVLSAQRMFIQLGGITKETLPQATQAAADFAAATGTDIPEAASALAKALKDPEEGLGMLNRQTRLFTDEEKKALKAMVETGHAAEASAAIIAKLEAAYKGSAEAARDTLGGALAGLKNAFGSLLEGDSSITGVKDEINELTKLLQDPTTMAGVQTLVNGTLTFIGAILKVTTELASTVKLLGEAFAVITQGLNDVEQALPRLAQKLALFGIPVGAFYTIVSGKSTQAASPPIPGSQGTAAVPSNAAGAATAAAAALLEETQALQAAAEAAKKKAAADREAATERQRLLDIAEAENAAVMEGISAQQKARAALEGGLDATRSLVDLNQQLAAAMDVVSIAFGATLSDDDLEQLRLFGETFGLELVGGIDASIVKAREFEGSLLFLSNMLDAGFFGDPESTEALLKYAEAAGVVSKRFNEIGEVGTTVTDTLNDQFGALTDTIADMGTTWGKSAALALVGIENINKSNKNAVKGYAQLTAGAAGFFKEESQGYKLLQAASQAFYTFEIAMQAASVVSSIRASAQKTVAKGTEATASGIAAVADQAASGPIVGFAMAAAMVAFLSSMGIKLGGGGSAPAPPKGDPSKGTGTVLGDPTAVSESLANSMEPLLSLLEAGLDVSRAMLLSLRGIEAAVAGVSLSLIRNFSITGNATPFTPVSDDQSLFNLQEGSSQRDVLYRQFGGGFTASGIDDPLGAAFGGLISGLIGEIGRGLHHEKTRTVASGLAFDAGQSIGDIIASGAIDGLFFATIKTTKRTLGIKTGSSVRDEFAELDPETAGLLTDTVLSIGDVVLSAVEMLGADMEAAIGLLNDVTLGFDRINLQDLSSEEIQERLSAVFSALGDRMAETVAVVLDADFLKNYQQVGEGALETLVRVATQTNALTSVLDDLGIVVGELHTPFGELAAMLRVEITQALIEYAGGIENIASDIGAFVEDFFTDQEQAALLAGQLSRALGELGLAAPDTREGFRDLVEGLNLTTDEGQRAFVILTNLAGLAGEYYDDLEGGAERLMALTRDFQDRFFSETELEARDFKELNDALAQLGLALPETSDDFRALVESLLESDIAAQLLELIPAADQYYSTLADAETERLAALEREAEALLDAANAARKAAKGIRDFLDQLSIGELSPLSPQERLAEAQRQFDALLTSAQGGDLESAQQVTGAAQDLLTLGRDIFASGQEYQDIFTSVTASLGLLASMLDQAGLTPAAQGGAANAGLTAVGGTTVPAQQEVAAAVSTGDDRIVAELVLLRGAVEELDQPIAIKVVTVDGEVIIEETFTEIRQRSLRGELVVYADGVKKAA